MSETNQPEYDDSYPTCAETYSTLCVKSDYVGPADITNTLQIEPTRTFRKGDHHCLGRLQRKTNGWLFSTRTLCDSKDTRRHIDLILAAIGGKDESVKLLQQQGATFVITSYWLSIGQGGPWLMPEAMRALGRLGIEVWWDVYFKKQSETSEEAD